MAQINLLAVVLVAVINMILGALWYSKILFGKIWLNSVNSKLNKENMKSKYTATFICALVMSYVLAYFINIRNDMNTLFQGASLGLLVGIGFVATTMATNYIFSGKSKNLYLIDAGYHLVTLIIIGAILAVWS